MNILFVHNNFPAQFKAVVGALTAQPGHKLAAIGTATARPVRGVQLQRYSISNQHAAASHPFARRFELECRRAEQVLYAATALKSSGFVPDVIVAHPGWGEHLPLKAVFRNARLVLYCEYFYKAFSEDLFFDPEFPQPGLDKSVEVQLKNAATLIGLGEADAAISPTWWQRSTFPAEFQPKIEVIHEGVDVAQVRPDPKAELSLPSGQTLRRGDEVITFVNRNFEPYRGYHVFMRALPYILRTRPHAQAVLIGGDQVSYGARPRGRKSWKEIFLAEVADRLDLNRVHFLGRIPYDRYLKALQVSRCHVYLTYPFVLSWSLIEAMSAGCLVVGSDTAPVREVIEHGRTGLLTDFNNPEALAAVVSRCLARPESYEAVRTLARTHVQSKYNQALCVRHTLDLLQSLAHNA